MTWTRFSARTPKGLPNDFMVFTVAGRSRGTGKPAAGAVAGTACGPRTPGQRTTGRCAGRSRPRGHAGVLANPAGHGYRWLAAGRVIAPVAGLAGASPVLSPRRGSPPHSWQSRGGQRHEPLRSCAGCARAARNRVAAAGFWCRVVSLAPPGQVIYPGGSLAGGKTGVALAAGTPILLCPAARQRHCCAWRQPSA
jgi:hypothetical protein